MPRLSAFHVLVIYMYIRDHGVAHFHARYGADEAVVAVGTSDVLRGGLPPSRSRLVKRWAELHRAELLDAWEPAANGEPPR